MNKNPGRTVRSSVASAVALVTAAMSIGCANKRPASAVSNLEPHESVTLAQLQPPVKLPAPPKLDTSPVSVDALEAYARGRDALLRNQKPDAVKYFTEAAGIEPESALVWRDLGYAQLGRDDTKAAVAFRRACAIDPNDADSRLQLARLLLTANKTEDAVTQLRLARLASEYKDDNGLAAVVDLLLGQSLEQSRYSTAAFECYEHVLAIFDDGDLNIRGRPELIDILQRPAVLVLRVADLATQCGKNDRAIALYQRLREQEPQLAPMIELRLARAELAKGDSASAIRRAFTFVSDENASVLSLAMFDEIFATNGGYAAALNALGGLSDPPSTNYDQYNACRALLTAHLLFGTGDIRGAREAINAKWPWRATKPINEKLWLNRVRLNARLAASDKSQQAFARQLLQETAAAPARWSVNLRGWEILTQPAQAKPLTVEDVLAIDLSGEDKAVAAARDFVASNLFARQGRISSSRQHADAASKAGFDVEVARNSPAVELPDTDAPTSKELATVFDAYRNDPDLLTSIIAGLLRGPAEERSGCAEHGPHDSAGRRRGRDDLFAGADRRRTTHRSQRRH
ncbi:MAG: tetratricopeptide repeat protein [Tepidisphaeraceae bacterium]